MTLIHQWDPQQTQIILALKELLPRVSGKAVKTSLFCDMLSFLDDRYRRRKENLSPGELWTKCLQAEWPENRIFFRPFSQCAPLPFHLLCQGTAAVFYGTDVRGKYNSDAVKGLYELFFFREKKEAPELPHLPERLQDKALWEAIRRKDAAKIIFLYGCAAKKGEKLKNMYHILLNAREYNIVMALHREFGGLDVIDSSDLLYHVVCAENELPEDFTAYVKQLDHGKEFFLWRSASYYDVFPQIMLNGLAAGVSPQEAIWKRNRDECISLQMWAWFLDELDQPLKECLDNIRDCDRYNTYGRAVERMKYSLAAAQAFVKWEKEQ